MGVCSVSGIINIEVLSTRPGVASISLYGIWTYDSRIKDSTFPLTLQLRQRKVLHCDMNSSSWSDFKLIFIIWHPFKNHTTTTGCMLAFYITNRTRWHLNSTPFHPPWPGPMTSWPNIQFPLLLRVWLHRLFPDQGFHSLFCTFFLTWNVLLLGLAPCICEH